MSQYFFHILASKLNEFTFIMTPTLFLLFLSVEPSSFYFGLIVVRALPLGVHRQNVVASINGVF